MDHALAAAIVLGFGFVCAKVTSGVPSKLQLFWETLVEQVSDLAESAIGPRAGRLLAWAWSSSSS